MGFDKRKELIFEEFKKFAHSEKLQGRNLLDIGCGNDYFKDKFKTLNIRWIGMDPVPNIESNIMLKGIMEKIPLHDNLINILFSSHSFEHTTNPIQTLKEFSRVLKPLGILFMVTPYPCQRQHFTCDKTHYFVLDQDQLNNLLSKSGFQVAKSYIIKENEDDELSWSIITIALN